MAQKEKDWVWLHSFAIGCAITWYIMQGRNEPVKSAVPKLCAAIRDLADTNKSLGILASTKAKHPTIQAAYEVCWEQAPRIGPLP